MHAIMLRVAILCLYIDIISHINIHVAVLRGVVSMRYNEIIIYKYRRRAT